MISFATRRSTKDWASWWKNRKIDWKVHYTDTWNHPHRQLLAAILGRFKWHSLLEIGCGSGPNLVQLVKHFPGRQMGGTDINADAIATAKKTFEGAFLKVCPADDVMMSDNSADIVLTDMLMLYISDPDKVIKEVRRIARHRAVFCELHSESWWLRMKTKYLDGYNVHNFRALLTKHGFYDIMVVKIPTEVWDGDDGHPQNTFGYIITAKVPKRK